MSQATQRAPFRSVPLSALQSEFVKRSEWCLLDRVLGIDTTSHQLLFKGDLELFECRKHSRLYSVHSMESYLDLSRTQLELYRSFVLGRGHKALDIKLESSLYTRPFRYMADTNTIT